MTPKPSFMRNYSNTGFQNVPLLFFLLCIIFPSACTQRQGSGIAGIFHIKIRTGILLYFIYLEHRALAECTTLTANYGPST